MALVVAMVLATTAACGLFDKDDPPSAASHATTTPTTTGSTTTTTAAIPAPKVTDPGAEPRRALRLVLAEGTTASVTVTSDLVVVQHDAGGDQTVDPPPVVQTIRYTVGKVDAAGAAVSFEVTDAAVATTGTALSPTEITKLTAALAPLKGLHGEGHLSPQGHYDHVSFTIPRGIDASVRTQIRALSGSVAALQPRLPDDAVGVGGTWTATDTTSLSGITLGQTTTYVVTAIDGDAVSYRSTTTVTGPAQPLSAEALGTLPGTAADLVSADLKGTGSGTLRLDRPASPSETTLAGTQVLDLSPAKVAKRRLRQDLRVVTRTRDAA